MSLEEIQIAIEALSFEERAKLNAWLQNWPSDDWDRQMEADARAGKFEQMIREADAAFDEGKCRPFP